MKLDEYQEAAARTAPRDINAYPECVRNAVNALNITGCHESAAELLRTFDRLIWCLGWAGEVGETLDMLKKHFGHGHPLDLEKLKKEFGDSRWYPANLERSFGLKSSEVAQANVGKLRARYPNGFSVEASKARVDVQVITPAERPIDD